MSPFRFVEIDGKRHLWRGESHLLIGLALAVTADLDRHLAVKPFQEIEQLVRGEAAEMPVHQVRHVGLRDAQNIGDLALLQLLVFEDLEHMKSHLRPHNELVGILEAEVGEDVAGALFEFNGFSLFRAHAPTPALPRSAS
jgi:hypothetical protein